MVTNITRVKMLDNRQALNKIIRNLAHLDETSNCNKYKNVFAPGTLGSQPYTYLVPVNCMLGLGVWHIDAR